MQLDWGSNIILILGVGLHGLSIVCHTYPTGIECRQYQDRHIVRPRCLIPGLALGTRRLHDINKSGWWLLIMLTGIGILLLIYWSLLSSKDEGNTF